MLMLADTPRIRLRVDMSCLSRVVKTLSSMLGFLFLAVPVLTQASPPETKEIVPGLVESGGSRRTAPYATRTC